jgi:hypothetical protein
MFKLFKIVSEIFQFCILQAIYAKNGYWLENKLKKIKNFIFISLLALPAAVLGTS